MAGESPRSGLPFRKGLVASALGTTNLVVAGAAGVSAAALHSLPLLALGGAAWAALIAWDLATPSFWRALGRPEQRGAPPPPELPDPKDVADPDAQRAARALLSAQKELRRVLAQSPQSVQHYAGQALGNVEQLEQAGARLIARADELSRYLVTVSRSDIGSEMDKLELQAQATSDPDAAAQFTSAREQRGQQLKTLDELVAARDRVNANLSRIVATYESLPGRVVHMRALDAQAVDAFSGGVNEELDRMNHEIAAFEDTLKGLSARVPA